MSTEIAVVLVSLIVLFFPALLWILLNIIIPMKEVENIFLRRKNADKDQREEQQDRKNS